LQAGEIDHALAFMYPYTRSGGPVLPATESDGKTESPAAIPEGARLQLDPSLDLSRAALAPYERTIARALQRYGMYLIDSGGGVAMRAQHPQSTSTPYPWGDRTYVQLPAWLLEHMRVLTVGAQLPARYEVVPNACASFIGLR
jgi:hypothetical protein